MTDQEIYESLREPLMRFASSLVGPDHAHDLVADAVTAAIARGRLADLENPRAYLMQAVLNRARSTARRGVRERKALARMPSRAEMMDAESFDPEIVRSIASLPVQQRAALYLVYWEDLAPTAAAELIGVRPATLRRYLHLAREKLRRALNE